MVEGRLIEVRVARKSLVATDIAALELVPVDGAALPAFTAGAHIDVHLPGGLVRQYSLCNDPKETHRYVIGVLKEPASRGGSVAVHALGEGDRLTIAEPRNHFALVQGADVSLLLAGGIGITPLLGMAEQLAADAQRFELHYCVREPARAAFRERIEDGPLAAHARLYFDSAPAEARADLRAIIGTPETARHLYVCGPAGFIDAVLSTARALGWAESHLHKEYFAAATPPALDGGAFRVKLASTGQIVEVGAHQTVVESLAAAGVVVPTSCEQGVCGTCLTRVIAGRPDHRDMYLTDEEREANDQFLPCCSRACTPELVIDL
ncbi:PDR/VanB family oxidoreductase [Pararobbsia silviterrae]|uniref:Oxidoreductase n=1 Tax=Pararobbsia silviterrae TaxID=1792498 RepID=A0A494X7E1_9BURK|nr:PDR/VanB family oxidoreductase [Pararobbsia silviterrae]RKP44216.1 oxidoreductase [Pararobbsia silviterrae]